MTANEINALVEDLVAWREVALGYRELARMFRVRAAQADRRMCSDPRFLASVDLRLAEIDRAVRAARGGEIVALPTGVPDFGSDVLDRLDSAPGGR